MGLLDVSRETKQIISRDFLVSKKEFLLKEVEKGLLKTTPKISDSKIHEYYKSKNYLSHNKGRSFFSFLYSIVSKFMLKRKTSLIARFIDPGGTFLDFGCGTGELVLKMQLKGYVCFGIENNSKAFKECVRKNIVVHKRLYDLKSKVDLISCWHSLEHLLDFQKTLLSFNKLIEFGGHLIIAVPNHDSFDAKYYGGFWAGYDVPRHRFHFNKEALIRATVSCGFNLIDSRPMLLDAYYVSILSEKYKKNPLSFLFGILIGFVSTLFYLFTKNASSHYFIFKKSK